MTTVRLDWTLSVPFSSQFLMYFFLFLTGGFSLPRYHILLLAANSIKSHISAITYNYYLYYYLHYFVRYVNIIFPGILNVRDTYING
jgi:hypothetical protein